MTTKEKLLNLFEKNKGQYFSGEELARRLELSRTAVWKAVNVLRSEGYPIDAAPNRGYSLAEKTDILSAQGIAGYLKPGLKLQLDVVPVTDSTNGQTRKKANEGAPEGYVLAAGGQTNGRGRMGRIFFSPSGSGVYFSLLLRPGFCQAGQALKITTMAAVAMCRAIEEISGEKPGIKWVNDIFVRGKKVCGILTEGAMDMESGRLEYAVLGMGVNLYVPEGGFPRELEDIAGAVLMQPCEDAKNRLVAAFLNRFSDFYHGTDGSCREQYQKYSLVTGKKITVFSGNTARKALALGIDSRCRLQVRYDDGSEAALSYGEISIRMET